MSFTLSMKGSGRNRNPIPSAAQLQARINAALDASGAKVKAQLERHTAYYTGGVDISVTKEPEVVVVGSNDMRLVWNNSGTRAHTIRARSGGSLAFQPNYQAKTAPNTIPSHSGGPSGSFVYAQETRHPGIEPRNIDKAIIAEVKDFFISEMRKAVTGGR